MIKHLLKWSTFNGSHSEIMMTNDSCLLLKVQISMVLLNRS